MVKDRLFEIFQKMLLQTHDMNETAPKLIRRVADCYALELLREGEIPLDFVDDVLTDLEAEVLEMYRKTTYGYLCLRSYRQEKTR